MLVQMPGWLKARGLILRVTLQALQRWPAWLKAARVVVKFCNLSSYREVLAKRVGATSRF